MTGIVTERRFTVLDLFSAAAGGRTLGLHRAGFVTVAACEIVEWRRILYSENFPHVRLYDDVRTLTAARLVSDLGYLPDIVVGSPPCQDISSANTKGKGIDGERSGLYLEAVRLVGDCRPRWFAFENSANLRTRGADRLLDKLEALGYAVEPCVVGADNVGANHVRKRSWLIGFDSEQLGDTTEIGRGSRRSGGRIEPVAGPCEPPCGDDADAGQAERRPQVERAGDRDGQAVERREGADRHAEPAASRGGNPAHPDEARQPDGRLEPGLRPQEVADDGCGDGQSDGWGDDGSRAGQVGGSAGAGGDAEEPWADWNGGLARHLRLDDGLSAWVAGTRIALGSRKGTSAASLIVEAFGDAVVPQIPEVIGRAILRTEAALDMVQAAFPPGIIRHEHDEPDEESESGAPDDGDAP